jgi:hypothetical protein
MYVTYLHMGLHHGNVDMKFNAQRRVSGITFINYTETQNNWEPNNSNVFEWKINKRPKHKEDISWNFQFCFIYIHWIYINHRIEKKHAIWTVNAILFYFKYTIGASWSWLNGSYINNYLCNQCLSPLKLWVWTPFMVRCTRYNIYDKVSEWFTTGRWFSPGTLVSSTNKFDSHDITEILLKVALDTRNHTLTNKSTNTMRNCLLWTDSYLPVT